MPRVFVEVSQKVKSEGKVKIEDESMFVMTVSNMFLSLYK